METIFIYLFIIILVSIIASFKTEKLFNILDNETKLKLLEVNIPRCRERVVRGLNQPIPVPKHL